LLANLCRWSVLFMPLLCQAAPLSVRVMAPDATGVSGVAVYLESGVPMPVAAPRRTVEIQQKDKSFAPYLTVIGNNDKVVFTNRDDITHHIYSVNGPARFSFKIREGEENADQQFNQPGIIAMGCNIHDWMSGYLLVADAAYATTTDSDGWARFDAIEPGDYRVVAWHPQMREPGPLSLQLTVQDRSELNLQLTQPMAEIPRQKGIDDFDFLDGY